MQVLIAQNSNTYYFVIERSSLKELHAPSHYKPKVITAKGVATIGIEATEATASIKVSALA